MNRGNIYFLDAPQAFGREVSGERRVMVVSDDAFNALFAPVVVPITTGGNYAREKGFTVSLAATGMKTSGVVLCQSPASTDVKARRGRFIERAPDYIVDEVIKAVATIFE